ncbi:DUF2950 domain-containing protein [Caballeronia ptereochthonis]|uniref:DUF2950 domain-containing protein n=1 Tax=Caballeronia ptereochthonis TaxID=1777144 RepID=A0A158A403_9BURK|nr:DUF2950 domain-containing protein [Caballeronia ptereochthonis]SAK52561.1 hypothetical protein AWB83_01285 [Caballeronia ptereochthonis]
MTPTQAFASPFLHALIAASLACGASFAHAQAVYPSAEAAAQALTDAIASNDETALARVLGRDHAHYVPADSIGEQDIYAYLGAWAQQHRIVEGSQPVDGHPSAYVEAGASGWTLPIPLVKVANGWRFDMRAARDEVLTRRIGRNERSAMQVALAYVAAQNDYHKAMNRYADRFTSTPGKHDGLYWDAAPGEPESPLGPLAATMPNKPSAADGYYGYHYRILTAQGPHAKGGAKNYLQGGQLTQGFGLIATPARYGQTGVMSFMVDQDGQIYEKDLGPAAARASAIKSFDPDSSWRPVSP